MKLFLVLSVFAIVFQGEAKTSCPPDSAWPVAFYSDPDQKKKAGDIRLLYLKQKPDNSLQRIGLERFHSYEIQAYDGYEKFPDHTAKLNYVMLGVDGTKEDKYDRMLLAFNKDYKDVGIVRYTQKIYEKEKGYNLKKDNLLIKTSDVGNDEHLYNFFDGEGKMLLDFSQENTRLYAYFEHSPPHHSGVQLQFLADQTPPRYISQQINDNEARVYELRENPKDPNWKKYDHCEGCKLSERGENECFVEKSSSVGAHSESPRFKQSKGKARRVKKRARRHSNRH